MRLDDIVSRLVTVLSGIKKGFDSGDGYSTTYSNTVALCMEGLLDEANLNSTETPAIFVRADQAVNFTPTARNAYNAEATIFIEFIVKDPDKAKPRGTRIGHLVRTMFHDIDLALHVANMLRAPHGCQLIMRRFDPVTLPDSEMGGGVITFSLEYPHQSFGS